MTDTDKCPKCRAEKNPMPGGSTYVCGTDLTASGKIIESDCCLRRQLTAANEKLAAANRENLGLRAQLLLDDEKRAIEKLIDEYGDLDTDLWEQLSSELKAAKDEIERLKSEQSRKDKATIDRLANKIFQRPLEEQ